MKGFILFAFSIFMSASALAGLPQYDPAVGYLRQEFVDGRMPADPHNDLKMYLNQVSCVFYSAQKNNSYDFQFKASFYRYGDLVRMAISNNSPWWGSLSRDMGLNFTEYGLMTHAGYFLLRLWRAHRPVYINLRASNTHPMVVGEVLLMEENMAFEARNELEGNYSQAVTHPRGYAFGYFACQ